MRLAQVLRLGEADSSSLFYALLMKDLGCTTTAPKLGWILSDDEAESSRHVRLIDWTNPQESLRDCWREAKPGSRDFDRLVKVGAVLKYGQKGRHHLSRIRAEAGAALSRRLRLPETTADALLSLDERWDGAGTPRGLRGEEIPLAGRICSVARTVEEFTSDNGFQSALDITRRRRGTSFDPRIVDALDSIRSDSPFWSRCAQATVAAVCEWEPPARIVWTDAKWLDVIAEVFADVVDAKSPWTCEHSSRVAQIAVGLGEQLGCPAELIDDVRRAGLLHDIGKLGVSNAILDKPGKPTEAEYVEIRKHAEHSHRILAQIPAFQSFARIAADHHERLDGRGYGRGVTGEQIHFVTRILTVADMFEAMSAQRPYRDAMPWDEIESILRGEIGKGIDGACVDALRPWRQSTGLPPRVEKQRHAVHDLYAGL
jgi:putative nucleotidyltransferase with HDIG domain